MFLAICNIMHNKKNTLFKNKRFVLNKNALAKRFKIYYIYGKRKPKQLRGKRWNILLSVNLLFLNSDLPSPKSLYFQSAFD